MQLYATTVPARTNGAASVRSHEVDLSPGNGTHSDLVKGTGEESSEGAAEDNVPVTTRHANPHTTDILLSNEALHIAIVEGLLVGERESGVLGVSIQSNDAIEALSKLHKGISVHLTSSMLEKKNVRSDRV